MTDIAVGQMRHRMTLESPVDAPDDNGGVVRSYQAVADIWANIEPVSARRDFVAHREEQTVSHRVTIRWRDDAAPACQFRLGARIFHIRAIIDPDERKAKLQCLCEEIV